MLSVFHRNRRVAWLSPGTGVRVENRVQLFDGGRVSIWEDENVLETDGGDGRPARRTDVPNDTNRDSLKK